MTKRDGRLGRKIRSTRQVREEAKWDCRHETCQETLLLWLSVILLLLLTWVVPINAGSIFSNAEPGPEASVAYELYNADDKDAACAAFLDQIHDRSVDPWVYRGVALCAFNVPHTRHSVLTTLNKLHHDQALRLFARGYLNYLENNLENAEILLRRSVEREPDLALAWSSLGSVVRMRGDAKGSIPLIKNALELSPGLETAKNNLKRSELFANVFERLLVLLDTITQRWDLLSEPLVPMSGLSPDHIFRASSDEEKQAAIEQITELVLTPLAERNSQILLRLEKQKSQEVDLWLPCFLAEHESTQNRHDEAALTIEAALQLAAATGRRDVLLFASNVAFKIVQKKEKPRFIQPVISAWTKLQPTEGSEGGLGRLHESHATMLFRLGKNEEALSAYRGARRLFQTVNDKLGLGSTWKGEADVLLLLGENETALSAYRQARNLFEAAGSLIHQGNAIEGEADVFFRLGENKQALSAYRDAHEIFKAVGDKLGQGNTLKDEADVLFRLGENEDSLSIYRQARQMFQNLGNKLGQGNTLDGEGDVLFILGRNEEALKSYRDARFFFQAIGDRLGQGNTLVGEANVLFRLNQTEEALSIYRKARQLFVYVGDRLGQGNTFKGEADILFLFGENIEAVSSYQIASRLFQVVGDRLGQGNSLMGEARVQFLLGETEKALRAYREARQFFRSVGEKLGQGSTFKGEADVLFRLGEYDTSLAAYREAGRLFKGAGDRFGEGNAAKGLADALLLTGHTDEALKTYREAQHFFKIVGSQIGRGSALKGEADAFSLLGEHEQALSTYRDARQIFEAANDALGRGNTLQGEADILFVIGHHERSATAAAHAAALFLQVEVVPNRINALLREAEARRQIGKTGPSIELAEEALSLFRDWRRGYVSEEHRTNFDAKIARAYDFLLPLLSKQLERLDDALERAEESRSRVLLDLLTSGGIGGSTAPDNLLRERERIHAQLAHLSDELQSVSDPAHRRELRTRRSALDADLQRNLYQRISAEGSEQTFGEPLNAPQIRNLARAVGPIILYYAAESDLIAFLVLPSGETNIHSVSVARSDLAEAVDDLVFNLANPSFERLTVPESRRLWEMLLGPFAVRLPPSGPLTILPHGPLHGLPFEALIDPRTGQRLFERWDIAFTPSASALHIARRERHQTPTPEDTFIAFAGGRGLAHTQADVQAVAEVLPLSNQKVFGPEEADYRNYKEQVSKARHLLIATRGVSYHESRRGTYLEIKPTAAVHDERLTAGEIATIPLRAELVTFAACDTDRGDALFSDERLTLTRSFLIAGAASVLATRWRVPEDRRTTRFLVDFYEAYRQGGQDGQGMRKDHALTEARRRALKRNDPAQVWAAWVLVGDAR